MEQETRSLTVTDQEIFQTRIQQLATWATIRSSRSRDLTYEWLAITVGLVGLYFLAVAVPKGTLNIFDGAIISGIAWFGFLLTRFERISSVILDRLVCDLKEEKASTAQSRGTSYG